MIVPREQLPVWFPSLSFYSSSEVMEGTHCDARIVVAARIVSDARAIMRPVPSTRPCEVQRIFQPGATYVLLVLAVGTDMVCRTPYELVCRKGTSIVLPCRDSFMPIFMEK